MSPSQIPNCNRDLSGQAIIVGAGCAGIETGLALRSNGWVGPITIFDDENTWPYHRPPLSKALLKGSIPEGEYRNRTAEVIARAGIDLHVGKKVEAINRITKTIHLTGKNSEYEYSSLILATGGRARALEGFPQLVDCRNVYTLRTLADAERIRFALPSCNRLVIVGGGFIGLEIAASAKAMGVDVQILEAGSRVLERALPNILSDFFHSLHREAGVEINTGVAIEGFRIDSATKSVSAVYLDHNCIACDMLVVAVGLEPNTGLAKDAGLHVSNGIIVNEFLQTDDSAIFAIGDCARFDSERYGNAIRLESVPNAIAHARRVSAVLCGTRIPSEEIPWFWTDQFDVSLKIAGLPQEADQIIIRGDINNREFSVIFHTNGRVNCVYSINRPSEFVAGKRLIEKGLQHDVAQLSDVNTPLISITSR
ncbi:FAD-dependent oxidoreductase [Ochrobactrum sp. Q0168]|uniref:NAD(P)/FAD-dependent oxidoreductase n=1 Tax=Ochrobactrum sp. Q0168 TaxID=2793241 RepID=UPI0018EBB22D|nr:FAD-dependent oxidoreductase [Ochrobactrum sp. Q0168]